MNQGKAGKVAAIAVAVGVLMLPVTAFAGAQGTTYPQLNIPTTNLPNTVPKVSKMKVLHGTTYMHRGITIQNMPRNSVFMGYGHHYPREVSNIGWAASNWSGYAITGSTYNDITGSWIVPTVFPSFGDTFSSSWIGIDGFNNGNLIQTGTEQDYVNGQPQYDAWWEILPSAETVIPTMSIHPGDHMSAHIHNNGNGTWTITISDLTQNETFSTTQAYSGPGTSAEWIQEAPEVNGSIARLANYGETTFNPGTVNGRNPGLTSSDGGLMIQNGWVVSYPSNPDSDTDGFNVAYGFFPSFPPQS